MSDSIAVSQVLRAERDWLKAHLNCDVAMLEHLMADEYAQISSAGTIVSKADVIASLYLNI